MTGTNMNFVGFLLVEVTNPNTGEVKKKLRVKSETGLEYNFLTEMSVEEVKAQKTELLSKIVLGEGPFGKFAMVRKSVVLEEF
jgi:hypothetical protein